MQSYNDWDQFVRACEQASGRQDVGATFVTQLGNKHPIYVFTPRRELGEGRSLEESYAVYRTREELDAWLTAIPEWTRELRIVFISRRLALQEAAGGQRGS